MKFISIILQISTLIDCSYFVECYNDVDNKLAGVGKETMKNPKKKGRWVKKDHQSRSEEDIKRLADIQNDFRRSENASNMNKLMWDDGLENFAKKWAEKCTFKHGQPPGRAPYNDIGQNIYTTSSKKLNLTAAALKWFSEKQSYNFDKASCSRVCGHYTQLVWADTALVGCASHHCQNLIEGTDIKEGHVVVCNYVPAGNYAGEDPYVKDDPCSGCGGPCEDGLCVNDY